MLAPWEENFDKRNLDSVLKSRDITLPTKVHIVKVMVFPVVMYRWELDHKEGWVLKNRCFWILVLEKTLESPWTSRRWNQSVLKEINPEYSLEGLMLKLKLHYFGYMMWRADSLEKTLMLGKIDGKGDRGGSIIDSMDMNQQTLWDSGGQRSLVCCSP